MSGQDGGELNQRKKQMKLYQHQIKALEITKDRTHAAYYLDMGLGKTFIGSEKAIGLNKNILVICQKSKVNDWIEHFNNYLIDIFDLTKQGIIQEFIKECDVFSIRSVGVINYDLIYRRPALLKLKDFTLILDESSIIQNTSTKTWKAIKKMNPLNVILLSGTPCSGKYENLWSQAHLLGWEIDEKTFLKHYINFKKIDTVVGIKKIVDKKNPYKNEERLKNKLAEHGAVFMKTEEAFELPNQTFIDVKVLATKEYATFMKESIVKLPDRKELIGNNSLTKLLGARQLCGIYNEDKLAAFRDLLTSTNDRLIVFYNFNDELEELSNIATELNKSCAYVNGHTKELKPYEVYDNCITFVQYQAGSKGLNLQKANKIIYFTPPLSVENWMQSQKRIHRIGQEQPCFYYLMKTGIDYHIYNSLERGVDYTDKLFLKEEKYGK